MKKLQKQKDYFLNYKTIGIVSNAKDYTISYYVNLNLDLKLVKYNNLIITNKNEEELSFTWYYYYDDIVNTTFFLIGNKSDNGYLLPIQKKYDYFLVIKNDVTPDLLSNTLDELRKVSIILAAFELDSKYQKKIETVLEANELHEIEIVNL